MPAANSTEAAATRSCWLAAALLIAASLAAYSNSFDGAFILDDEPCIVRNATIRSLSPSLVLFPPPEALTVVGRPLLNLSLAINYAVHGLDLAGYHFVNVAIHLLAGLTLFDLVRRTLQLPSVRRDWEGSSTLVAAAAAIVWTVHPLQTESVSYIVQRGEALVGLFFLLTLYGLLQSVTDAARGTWWQALAVAACLLGALTKEVIVTVVPVAMLYDRAFLSETWSDAFARRGRLYLGLCSSWVVVGLLLSTTEGRGGSAGFGLGLSAWEYARMQLVYVPMYLKLSVWPDPLVLDYGLKPQLSSMQVLTGGIVVALLLAATVWCLVYRPKIGMLAASFWLILAPTSSVVPLAGQVAAERRMYLPLAAALLLILLAVDAVCRKVAGRRPSVAATFAFAAIAVLIALAGIVLTRERNAEYRSPLKLWQKTAALCPDNYRAHYNLGNSLAAAGQHEQALASYDRAISLEADNPQIYCNRANSLIRLGRISAAERDCRKALDIAPELVPALYNLAAVYESREDFSRALSVYERIARQTPADPDVQYFRGLVLQRLNRHKDAVAAFSEALELSPEYRDAWRARAASRAALGQTDQALADMLRFVRLGGTP